MKFLYLDTSYQYCRLALIEEQGASLVKDQMGHRGMENTVFEFLEAFKQEGLDLASIDALVVLRGPGSFTGLRIGMSIMKSLAYAFKKPLLSLSTLEVHAHMLGYKLGSEAVVLTLMDARNQRAFGRLQQGEQVLVEDGAGTLEEWKEKANPYVSQLSASLETQSLLPEFNYQATQNTLEDYDYASIYALCMKVYEKGEKDPFKQSLAYLAPTQVERLQNIELRLEDGIEFLT